MIVQHATRADWLRDRLNGIGGSDAPAVLGVSSYSSPFKVWADRAFPQEVVDEPPPAGTPMDFGLRFERPIAEVVCAQIGATLEDLRAPGAFCASVVLDEMPFLRSTPDFLVRTKDGRRGVLQVKNVDISNADDWRLNNAPDEYEVQLQHELLTCQSMDDPPTFGILGACIGGNRTAIRERMLDESFAVEWATEAAAFWKRVQTKTPPLVDGAASTKRAALLMAAKARREEIAIFSDAEMRALAEERIALDLTAKAAKKRMDEIDARFIVALGDRNRGEVDGIGRVHVVDVADQIVPAHWEPDSKKDGYSYLRWYGPKNTATPSRRRFR